MPEADDLLLQVRDLRTWFLTDAGPVRAVDGVSFDLRRGETLGIVGESGSGKSVCAKSIMRLLDEPARIVDGTVAFRGQDLAQLDEEQLRELRGRDIAMVFQDPMTSLNPVLRIARQLVEAMTAHGRFAPQAARERALALLGRMGVPAPARAVRSYPHQYSGGMRQRVMLAMGVSNEPALLIADEPTTALDVTIQAQILELLRGLNADLGTAVILISHDLGVIANICSRVLVMYAGEVVEEGAPEALLGDPRHPYTWALLNAAPRLDSQTEGRRLTTIEGQPPDPRAWPTGCRFRARCPFAVDRCAEHPALLPIGPGRSARCWVTQEGGVLRVPAHPRQAAPQVAATAEPLLVLSGLAKHFDLPRESLLAPRRRLRAVDGVDLTVRRGETVGLVGESGCGKSTLARLVTRLHEPTAGQIRFAGQDITHLPQAAIRPLRRRMQMIFQDPYASLNPRMAVGEILAGPLLLHGIVADRAAAARRVAELLDMVNLPAQAAARFPHEFSGGQRQRISIARALALQPDLVVADEPVSALDVNIQAQIINLMVELQERLGLTYLFIAHDLAVVRHVCDRIVVLYLGKVMEVAPAEALFRAPRHPYTRTLIAAVPVPDPALERGRRSLPLRGEPPNPISPPRGCRFVTRCPLAQPLCGEVEPELRADDQGGAVACHFAGPPLAMAGHG
ncbi:ABC transporter ATP-binding protein [Paracraurococcus lichenis]|uniref:ABC transporter ATP-binding protein n=1 Tax=Paracraurococcus lichenis TaxID=3064888 RepID=A0ABT9E5X0_9PROT|nr:ABC transporter ATP-binding protein [Paracraurococcus sp. LOR1-02]MDO9711580.1 ABC transporter ATP-binding protein [Paracraurococcus sp. LOR1-02]